MPYGCRLLASLADAQDLGGALRRGIKVAGNFSPRVIRGALNKLKSAVTHLNRPSTKTHRKPMNTRQLWFAAGFVLSISVGPATAQQPLSGRVAPPETTIAPPSLSADQVERCLFLARDIAGLSDEADRAKRANDNARYNSTVAPYNRAISQWNNQCAESYSPGDMIRAEDKNGFKLCTYTSSPCLTEEQRRKILEEEKRAPKKN